MSATPIRDIADHMSAALTDNFDLRAALEAAFPVIATLAAVESVDPDLQQKLERRAEEAVEHPSTFDPKTWI